MANLVILPSLRQSSWGWPAVVNLALGGAGSGFYLIGVLIKVFEKNKYSQAQFVPFELLALTMVFFGFLALSFEAGKPFRANYLISNLTESWMSIESLAGGVFIITVLINCLLSYVVFKAISVIAAIILLVSQGFIVYRSLAVITWNVWPIPVVFITSGLMTGSGLILLNIWPLVRVSYLPVIVSLICILLNLIVWLLYLYGYHDTDFRKATEAMRHFNSLIVIVGVGHLLPLILLLSIGFYKDFENSSPLLGISGVISGLALILGGASQKTGIILRSGYFRRIVLRSVKNQGQLTFPS